MEVHEADFIFLSQYANIFVAMKIVRLKIANLKSKILCFFRKNNLILGLFW